MRERRQGPEERKAFTQHVEYETWCELPAQRCVFSADHVYGIADALVLLLFS